ncbi:MAG: cytidylate kinase-like family protein [Oscillospiraceae bacterium]|nr:cytidylate kinase-like family protein [Oscillospiraceae bacterium]
MRIITISRQFGSGGRELGKRLSDCLGWDYYDRQILETLAEEHNMDAEYVRRALANHGWQNIQLSYRSSFKQLMFDPGVRTQLLVRQREILQQIAALGQDCVIVGRDADVILQDCKPFRIFACADLEARLRRCLAFEEKKPRRERLGEKEILRNIRRIDKNRARTREVLTGKTHGDASAFDLTVNTSGWEIKKLAAAVADFALCRFEG